MATGQDLTWIQDFHQALVEVFVRVATLPYYRLYHFNTIDPLRKIAAIASESSPSDKRLLRAIASWRQRKLSELQFITLSVSSNSFPVILHLTYDTSVPFLQQL